MLNLISSNFKVQLILEPESRVDQENQQNNYEVCQGTEITRSLNDILNKFENEEGNVYLFVENADHILIEGQNSKEQSVQNNLAAPDINRCPFLIFMKDDLGSIETPARCLQEHFIGA